ncbi:MAG: YceH family protein [Chthoniobacterales bacterium]
MNLDPIETRILGCLLEKERLTPENYPLSLNSLTAACNQTTNREPVVDFSEKLVEETLANMREKKIATVVFGAGSRVQKYRHNLGDHFTLTPAEIALLCILLLRGPQTVGELRTRSERMTPWESLAQVESVLTGLAAGDEPLVRLLPMRPGQKEQRYLQLLGATMEIEVPLDTPSAPATPTRMDRMEAELASLRAEFESFRKQFEG